MSKETDFQALFVALEKKYNALNTSNKSDAEEKVSLEKKVNSLLQKIEEKEKADAMQVIINKGVVEIQKHNNAFEYKDEMASKTFLEGYAAGITAVKKPIEKNTNSSTPVGEGGEEKLFTPKGMLESDKAKGQRISFGHKKPSEGAEL